MRPNPQKIADLVTFTEEILNGKRNFLCSDSRITSLTILQSQIKRFKGELVASKAFAKSTKTTAMESFFCNFVGLLNLFGQLLL